MAKSQRFSPFLKQCFVTIAVCSNTIGHGCLAGFPAVLLPQLHQAESTITLTKEDDSWIASVMGITLLVGSQIIPPIMGRLGRKAAHFAVTVPILVGWITVALATSVQVLIIGRIIQGMSFGMMLPLRSVLIGEYTSPRNRGAFLTTVSFAQAFGIFLVHLLGSLIKWQTTAFICISFPLISFIMTIYCPESPSWLADKGRFDECRKTFRWLRGDDEEEELEEMIQARRTYENNRQKIKNVRDVATIVGKKEFYKPLVLMIHCYIMGEFCGGALMACYSTIVINKIAGPDANPHVWMIELDAQRFVFNGLAVYIINKVKRRTMMFATGGLCIISHLAIATYVFARIKGFLPYGALWLPILLINMQFLSVAMGMVSLPYVIAGEVFPLEYRSIGGSISIISIASAFFLITKTFPSLVEGIGIHGTYVVYAGVLAYGLLVVGLLLPETKGRTLQQIEDEFRGKVVREEIEAMEALRDDCDDSVKR